MKGLLILAVCASFGTNARAGELRSLLSVRSVAELETTTRKASIYKLTHETCVAELAARLLPRACFRELSMSKTPLANSRAQNLERICIQNAKASRSRLDLSASSRDLPASCQKVSAERLEDLQYIDEARSPESSVMRTPGPELEEASLD